MPGLLEVNTGRSRQTAIGRNRPVAVGPVLAGSSLARLPLVAITVACPAAQTAEFGQKWTVATGGPFVVLPKQERAHCYMKPNHFLNCVAVFIASLAPFAVEAQTSIAEQQDARVIENLRHNGADLTKVHDVDFFLVFGRQSDAISTADKIRVLGYEVVSVDKAATGKQWEVHAKRKMVPELKAMQASTRALQALAESHSGYYDGWGTVGIK